LKNSLFFFDLHRAVSQRRTADFTPPELLAAEEALLDYCEATDHPGFLTFWESQQYFVVLGYGKQLSSEVYEGECQRLNIPILRRSSGGGTVLQGPGCINYSVVLPIESWPELASITGANRLIMEGVRDALAPELSGKLEIKGHTDLTLDGLKFSGNAQRRKRRCLLFHGSILVDFDLELISRTLKLPQIQPDYRSNRAHGEFIRNLGVSRERITAALQAAWTVKEETDSELPGEIEKRMRDLVKSKYGNDDWNRRS
jgi:lipoate---protein ligase